MQQISVGIVKVHKTRWT